MAMRPELLTVKLSHASNPDIAGGYWDGKPKQCTMRVRVRTIEEAQAQCRAYIEQNGLGGGNWTGGQVTDETKYVVGRIAYNGRFFPTAD